MMFGGERIEYGLLPQAHTDGDIFVHFRNANVLAVGDVVQPGRLPTQFFPPRSNVDARAYFETSPILPQALCCFWSRPAPRGCFAIA